MSAAEAYQVLSGEYVSALRRTPPDWGSVSSDAQYGVALRHRAATRLDSPFFYAGPIIALHAPELPALDVLKVTDLSKRIERWVSNSDDVENTRRHAKWEELFRNLAVGSIGLALAGFAAMLIAWFVGNLAYVIPASVVAFGFTLVAGILLELSVKVRQQSQS